MIFKECPKTYKQPITIIITAVNHNLYKNTFRLTPKKVGSYMQVFTVPLR